MNDGRKVSGSEAKSLCESVGGKIPLPTRLVTPLVAYIYLSGKVRINISKILIEALAMKKSL